MNYIWALLIVLVLSAIFVLSYYLNSKIKVDCDKNEMCEGCTIESCYHNIERKD